MYNLLSSWIPVSPEVLSEERLCERETLRNLQINRSVRNNAVACVIAYTHAHKVDEPRNLYPLDETRISARLIHDAENRSPVYRESYLEREYAESSERNV